MTLWKRILLEKRALIIPLAVGIVLNIGAYALVVYPLGKKSAGAADRAVAAAVSLKAAQQEQAAAAALVSGKSRAEQELSTFYGKVLPADFSSARRLTYAALAQKTPVKFLDRRFEPEPILKDARFGRLKATTQLSGEWEDIRRYIFELESAPEFVIIDNVTLTQAETSKPLTLRLELSTYYRLPANGN